MMDMKKLSAAVVAVRVDIKELKDTMKKDVTKLHNEIAELKDTIKNLTETITQLSGHTNNTSINTTTSINTSKAPQKVADKASPKPQPQAILVSDYEPPIKKIKYEYFDWENIFPISTQDDLDFIEQNINEDNKDRMVDIIKQLISNGGITKNVTKIIAIEVLLNYNVDGKHCKKRLQDYRQILEILRLASDRDPWNENFFIDDMRKALKVAKNRHFKKICLLRKEKRIKSNLEQWTDAEATEYVDVDALLYRD